MRSAWLLAVLCSSVVAHAQPSSEADRLFEEGRALAKAGDFAGACDRFAKSLELDHSLGTELNLADCHENLGHLREAWRLFTAVAQESARSADTKRTDFARERAAAVAAKLATIVIQVERPMMGMTITVGDHAVEPTTQIIDLVEPGAVRISATVPRHRPFETTVDGQAGVTHHVTIPPFVESEGPTPDPDARYERSRGRVYLAYGIGGGAIAVGAGALGLALKARSDYNTAADGAHCDRVTGGIRCDDLGSEEVADAQRLANIGTGLAIGAGVLAVTAVVLYATAPAEKIRVAPVATPERVGFVLSRAF